MTAPQALYTGKAKTVYPSSNPDEFILEFRDDTSRFNGLKIEQLARKGMVNNYFNAFIMEYLAAHGVATHFIKRLSDITSLVKRLNMVPVECVVRNRAAGGIAKRLGLEEGLVFAEPIFEFFYKNDALGDPMVNDSHVIAFEWANAKEIAEMKALSLKVNTILQPLFAKAGLILVDYKLEFGRADGHLVLGDEFSPDGCRVWDQDTLEKLDKDRFRQDLGNVVESYEIIAERLGITLPK
ncbi:MAG: phosphoribosylaminoimidazolesuccinocarboxamide synthase [Gammaproteobacteria bacterium]|nr:phosphoribosylaminoimidazolesuccinocarboxamide synthase [Gammaproteobacteria bacterium]